ncbi:uncharacterized protein LOC127080909 [Lathyrus oleraceus]|uniref:uncharacterized protein LOC127080909 n=1 Tax=Pisum sativum TaxID=3888 RepID=UPI0021D19F9B|nr:uncharacterized protein LOC127080909 [Pisum sativum]
MNVYGELTNNWQKIEKALRSTAMNFDYIIMSIEESKNLTNIKLEELKASLEAHEMRMKQRNSEREKVSEHALQARFIKKSEKKKAKEGKNLDNDEKSSKNSKNHSDSIKKGMGNKYYGKKVDMKEVHFYNCQGFDHYARDCRRKKDAREKYSDEVKYAHVKDSDFEDVILMENTHSNTEQTNMLYLDLGYSNNMSSNKTLFTKLDESVEKVIKFADETHQVEKEISTLS